MLSELEAARQVIDSQWRISPSESIGMFCVEQGVTVTHTKEIRKYLGFVHDRTEITTDIKWSFVEGREKVFDPMYGMARSQECIKKFSSVDEAERYILLRYKSAQKLVEEYEAHHNIPVKNFVPSTSDKRGNEDELKIATDKLSKFLESISSDSVFVHIKTKKQYVVTGGFINEPDLVPSLTYMSYHDYLMGTRKTQLIWGRGLDLFRQKFKAFKVDDE